MLLGVTLRARVAPLRRALESPKAKLPLKCVGLGVVDRCRTCDV